MINGSFVDSLKKLKRGASLSSAHHARIDAQAPLSSMHTNQN